MQFQTEVIVKRISVRELLERYLDEAGLKDACNLCPSYGRTWSCPPHMPDAESYFSAYRDAYLIGVKVIYDPKEAAEIQSALQADRIQEETYEEVKRILLETLLAMEKLWPGTHSIHAGRCEQCIRCTRLDGKPCRKPERMRYTFSAFRFRLVDIAKEQLHTELKWSAEGLPAYHVAIGAFLVP